MDDTAYDTQDAVLPVVPQAPQMRAPTLPEQSAPEMSNFQRYMSRRILGYDPVAEKQRREEVQFWKQQQFAQYQLSQRENLSNEFNELGDKFFAQQSALNQARMSLASQEALKAPPEILAPLKQAVVDGEQALQFTRAAAMSKYTGIQQIDDSMPAMIANFQPPRSAFGGGQEQGGGEQPPMPQMPPSGGRYEMPGYASPSETTGSEPSGPVNDQMAAPQAQPQMPPATEQWRQILESDGVGFPVGSGKPVNGRLTYYAPTSQRAKDMREALKAVEDSIPGALKAPVDIVDQEEAQEAAKQETHTLRGEVAKAMGKAASYRRFTEPDAKESDILDALKMARELNDTERIANLLALKQASVGRRTRLAQEMVREFEDEANAPRRRIAELRPLVEGWDRTQLAKQGITVIPKDKQTLTEFGREFAENQGWDWNSLSDQQIQMIAERWKAQQGQ